MYPQFDRDMARICVALESIARSLEKWDVTIEDVDQIQKDRIAARQQREASEAEAS